MRSRSIYPVVLGAVCLVSGLTLGVTYSVVRGRIAAKEQDVLKEALRVALPEAEEFVTGGYVARDREGGYHVVGSIEEFERDRAEKNYVAVGEVRVGLRDGEMVGHVAEGFGQGYSSRIRVAVGIDADASKVVAIKVVFQQETPGLGARVNEVQTSDTLWSVLLGKRSQEDGPFLPWFQANFSGVSMEKLLTISTLKGQDINGDGKPDAITGASISSNAVLRAVRDAIGQLNTYVTSEQVDARSGGSVEHVPSDEVGPPPHRSGGG
jgi:electron transport complex protein RnfG